MQDMRVLSLLPLLLSCWGLQACNSYVTDQLQSSSSSTVLPLGPVHVPARDSVAVLQMNLNVSGMDPGPHRIHLDAEGSLQSSEGRAIAVGPSELRVSPFQVHAMASIQERHLRIGGGLDLSPRGGAPWIELGARGGQTISVEAFLGLGLAQVKSELDWKVEHERGEMGEPGAEDYRVQETRQVWRGFQRLGLVVAARKGGPWVEAQVLGMGLLPTSPNSKTTFGTGMSFFGAGWTHWTSRGALTASVRLLHLGKERVPVFGIQWTGEGPLR